MEANRRQEGMILSCELGWCSSDLLCLAQYVQWMLLSCNACMSGGFFFRGKILAAARFFGRTILSGAQEVQWFASPSYGNEIDLFIALCYTFF